MTKANDNSGNMAIKLAVNTAYHSFKLALATLHFPIIIIIIIVMIIVKCAHVS